MSVLCMIYWSVSPLTSLTQDNLVTVSYCHCNELNHCQVVSGSTFLLGTSLDNMFLSLLEV